MRPTPTRITRWARIVGKSREPLAKVTSDVRACRLAAKGGRLTYVQAVARDLENLRVAFVAVETSLMELGAHEERRP